MYVEVDTNWYHNLALRSDGSIVAWGSNEEGQCDVPALPPGVTYIEADAGYRSSVARRSDGVIVTWGDDEYGQTTVPPLAPGHAHQRLSSCSVVHASIYGSPFASASATCRGDSAGIALRGYTATAPIMGSTWTATVDNRSTGHFLAGVRGYANPLELYLPRTGGYLLIDPLSPGGELTQLPPKFGYGIVAWTPSIPIDPLLAGFTLSTQGAGIGSATGTTMYNAYDLVVGH